MQQKNSFTIVNTNKSVRSLKACAIKTAVWFEGKPKKVAFRFDCFGVL